MHGFSVAIHTCIKALACMATNAGTGMPAALMPLCTGMPAAYGGVDGGVDIPEISEETGSGLE